VKHLILERYVLKNIAQHWIVLFLGLLVIMTVGQLPLILGRAAEHELATNLVFEVLMLMVVANMPIVILLTLLLATVTSIGRLSHDGELTAMRATGFSPLRLFAILLLFSLPILVLLVIVTHEAAPRAYCNAVLARADAAQNMLRAKLRPGVFLPLGERGTLFAKDVAPDGELRQVFAYSEHAGVATVLTSARGRVSSDDAGKLFYLALIDGEIHEGIPGERRFRVVRFHNLTRPIIFPAETQSCVKPDTLVTSTLWRNRKGESVAELNLRFGQCALAVAFLIVGVPLSITRPRKGAFSRVPIAICAFAISMFAVLGISNWSARETTLGTIALWSAILIAVSAGTSWLYAIQHGGVRPRAGS